MPDSGELLVNGKGVLREGESERSQSCKNLAKVWYNININPKKEMNDYDNETKRII